MANYPQRIGEPECRDFLRTGRCKYGDSCKYHHPIGGTKAINPNEPPFPIRPDEPTCQYYLKNATCKFGQTCKFNHPPEILLSKSNAVCSIIGNQNGSSSYRKNQDYIIEDGGDTNNSPNSNDRPRRDYGEINNISLPQRPGEPECIYYLRNGKCKYGSSCKYHHPPRRNNGRETILPTNQVHVQGKSVCGRQRSSSDSIVEGRGLQAYLISGVLHQPGTMKTPAAYMQENSFHHMNGPNTHLGTINNSFQQYPPPPPHTIDMANGVNLNGNGTFIHPLNSHNVTPKMGSPSMSSTTVASSYDTASLETLPPLRIPGQSVMGSPSGMHSQLSSYSDLPKLNLSQVNGSDNNVPNGQQFLLRANSKDEMLYGVVPPMDNSHGNDLIAVSNRSHQQLQHHPNSLQYNHPPSMIQNQSSNTSIASLSPKSEKKSINSSIQNNNNNNNNNNRNGVTHPKPNRTIDDGLSMMTDALLTMLDTQEDTSNNNKFQLDSNENDFMQQRRRNTTSRQPARNSLPDKLLSSSASRIQQMINSHPIEQSSSLSSSQYPSQSHSSLQQQQQQQQLQIQQQQGEGSYEQQHQSIIMGQPPAHPHHHHHQQQQQQMGGVPNNRSRGLPPVDTSGRSPTQFYIPS